jgi:cellulose synthase (UDP-forming)
MGLNPFPTFWADWRRRLPYRRYGDLEDRPRRLAAQTLSLLTLLLGALYLAWLGRLMWRAPGDQSILFFIAETLAYLLLVFLAWDLGWRRYHRPEGLEFDTCPPVDILVTYCGEPLEVISTTLRAVGRIHYQPVQVYVLDDYDAPPVAALAQSLGFHYHSRVAGGLPRRDAKSGNLNFGLGLSQGELVLVLDADQVPAPDILTRLVGFFRLPQVAYVQSKQSFHLPAGDPFFNRDEIFYEVVQPSNDQANAVISCGSGVLYRRAALADIGGFATWNILEDTTTSYELLSRGWKGLYFPYALSRGLAPLNLAGVYRQRFQWCLDTMRLFFWDNPLRKPGLTREQRLHFLLTMVNYLISGLVFPAFYFLPLLGYWEGYSCFQDQELYYLGFRGAYLGATILMFRYLFFQKDALKQFKILCGLSPVYTAAILAALVYPPGRKPAYRVNNRHPFTEATGYLLLLPQLGIVALHLTLPFLSLQLGWAPPHLIVLNGFFSAFVIWVLADLVVAGLKKPQWHPTMDPRQVYGS